MAIHRVAVIFDNSARPETTGLYCRRALGSLVEIEHFQPAELDEIPPERFDLFLYVDDGLKYAVPEHLRPSAWWAIDTHLDFERALSRAQSADYVFAAQCNGAERLKQEGIDSAVWLPLAFDPSIHHPQNCEKQFDVAFVGNQLPGPRAAALELIQQRFPNTFLGRCYFEQMARTYSAARIVFNRSVADDVNMRVFEALGCGTLLVTNDLCQNGQADLMTDGVHLVTYADADEMLDKIGFYLQRDDLREQIATAGRAEALARHTYHHRMVTLLEQVERQQSRTSLAVPALPTAGTEPKVSACLVSWKRPENIRQIVDHLRSDPLIDDIVVWNNNPQITLEFDDPDVTVIPSDRNLVTYGRYLATRHARHDIIYTQDDDCLVHNIGALHASFQRDGSCITHALKLGHLVQNVENFFGSAQMALVGWGAFFRKEWCEVLGEYTARFTEDDLLIRKADRIFTLLLDRRHRSRPADVTDLPGASGPESLSVREDHFQLTEEAVGRALALIRQRRLGTTPVPDFTPPSPIRTEAAGTPPSTPVPVKEQAYFAFARPELLARIPTSARRLLDVGCGAGMLGATLKQRQAAEVWGIERDPEIAHAARARLDHVICANAEGVNGELEGERFDAIVCGDLLEHLRDPLAFLRRARGWLTDDGCLIASIPNVRHWCVIASLLEGNWTYEAAGLLDEDHLRFFTRREIEKLMFRAGFDVADLGVVPGPGYQSWAENGRPGTVHIGRLQVAGLSPEQAEEFYTYQYLVVARPARPPAAIRDVAAANDRTLPEERPLPPEYERNLVKLKTSFAWPQQPPDVEVPEQHTGWLGDGLRRALDGVLNDETRLVVELGSWLGLSTRYAADRAPQATIVAVDHWEGSPEHQRHPQWQAMLPTLLETFQLMCWSYRERMVPLRMTTLSGLRTVAEFGLIPDVIVIDAEHSYEAVSGELALCRELFPGAAIVGDDHRVPEVARAVSEFARQHDLNVEIVGDDWPAWKLCASVPVVKTVPIHEHGLTSIIIVTHNELAYTRQCVESIRRLTDEPYELIFIDNGSTDGTPDYLESLQDATLIRNTENRGFPAAVNQGLAVATGENVLLLNNDTLVTTGWLRRMLDALHRETEIGLVGPLSNNVSGPQQIPAGYDELSQLDGFAWQLGQQHRGQTTPVPRLVGFCLLIKREVIDQIGPLDEQFGIGNFEDDDYCRRAIAAGYRVVIARDAFVHHFGSRTFRATGIDFAGLLAENQKKYDAKWSGGDKEHAAVPEISAPRPSRFTLDESPLGGLRLRPAGPRLSLCMIVRDNESTIRPCLESIRPWVDEIIIVDTGSTDRTPEICRELGAQVYEFAWCDDFSAARNESLKYARGEWIFWMDSDDTIPAECGQRLRALADGRHESDVLGYVMQVHCPGPDSSGTADLTAVDHVKLFRNRPDLRFEHRIHEQVLPAIRRAGGKVAFTDLYVIHSGSDHSPEGRQRKLERDFRILKKDLAERPDHPFVLFNLGMTCADTERYDEAVDYLNRSIDVAGPDESHLRKAYALLASSYAQSDRYDEAWQACCGGLELFSDDKELLFRSGMMHHHFGRLREAETAYHAVLSGHTDRHFQSVDQGITGYKARHNLALVYEEMGKPAEAEHQWRLAVEEQPAYRPGWRGLAGSLLQQHKIEAARHLAGQLRQNETLRGEGAVLSARLLEQSGDIAAARYELEAALDDQSDDLEPLRELCRLLFERASPLEAETALRRLVEHDPEDASARHNLGTACMSTGRYYEAAGWFRESLRIRPDSDSTRGCLDEALKLTGSNTDAEHSAALVQD